MAIDVIIKAGLFHQKPLPFEVIIGDELFYGNAEDYVQTMDGQVGKREFIAFLPENIGRGFQVIWHEGESRRVVLRQTLPCCEPELREFYQTVRRITEFWKGHLTVDGKPTTLKAFMNTLADNISFNMQAARDLGRDILNSAEYGYEIYGAMWPLHPGEPEGRMFLLSPESFGEWLHEKQEVDACYWPIVYGIMQDGQSAMAGTIYNPLEVPYIYLDKVPEGYTTRDSRTGQQVPVTTWWIVVKDGEGSECEISYQEFRAKLPANKVSRFDKNMILIQPMTPEEIRSIYFTDNKTS